MTTRHRRATALYPGLLVALLAGLVAAGCGGKQPQPAPPPAAPRPPATEPAPTPTPPVKEVPKALTDLGEHAEDIFDTVAAKDWKKAQGDAAWFEQGLDAATAAVKAAPADAERLAASTKALRTAIAGKDRVAAQRAANDITHLVARLGEPFNPKVPVAVADLDYYGRELRIWSEAKDLARLQTTAADLQKTWEGLRPTVEAKGGQTQARAFDGLIAKLQQAKTVPEYAALVTPILDQIDEIEKVFTA